MPTVYYRLNKPNKTKDCSVMVVIYFSQKVRPAISTGRKVPFDAWDAKKQRLKSQVSGSSMFNLWLETKRKEVEDYVTNCDSLHDIKKKVKSIYLGISVEENKKLSLPEYIDFYVEMKKASRTNGYLRKFGPVRDVIKELYGDCSIGSIGYQELEEVANHLIDKGDLNNTINGYIKKLKTVITHSIKRGYKIDPTYEDFNFGPDSVSYIPIYWEEIETLAGLTLEGAENDIRNLSLIRAYTSVRFSDMNLINRHTVKERGGECFFDFTMMKTRSTESISIPDPAMDIIRSYNYSLPRYSQQEHNRLIKQICRKAGLKDIVEKVRFSGSRRIVEQLPRWKTITTHSFRRAHARKLYDEGIELEYIQKRLGHTNPITTLVYIGVQSHEVNKKVNNVFNYKGLRIAK